MLGNIGGTQARQALITFLKDENNQSTKLTLVDAIAKIGDDVSIRILEEQQKNLDSGSGLATFLNEILIQENETNAKKKFVNTIASFQGLSIEF